MPPIKSDLALCRASSQGIRQCLRMLAEEAASLNLSRTVSALYTALAICEQEVGMPMPSIGSLPTEEAASSIH